MDTGITHQREEPGAPDPVYCLRGHSDGVNALSFISTSVLASGAGDGTVFVWDLLTRRPAVHFTPHGGKSILSLSPLPARERLLSCGRDGAIKVWDINALSTLTGSGASVWDKGPDAILDTHFSQFCNASTDSMGLDRDCILAPTAASDGAAAVLWDLRTPAPASGTAPSPCLTVAAGPTAERGILCSLDYISQDPTTGGGPVALLAYESGAVYRVCLRTSRQIDGSLVGDSTPALTVHAVAQPHKQRTIVAAAGAGSHVSLTTHNAAAAVADVAAAAATSSQSPAPRTCRATLPREGTGVVRVRGDGRLLFSGHWDCSVRLHDTRRLKPLAVLRFHRDSVNAGTFGPHGSIAGHWLATGSKDGCIAMWDLFGDSYKF